MSKSGASSDTLLAEQVAYYRAISREFEHHAITDPADSEWTAQAARALDGWGATGDVLELACGPGTWTKRLVDSASSVTAVDAAPEMLALAKAELGSERVRFIHANLFEWTPDRSYDVVFFAFWLSHVPLERFESFWTLVRRALKPAGRVFFVDDAYRTPDELIEGEASSTIQRRSNDGTPYRAVKVPHRPADLQQRLERLGWSIRVTPTAGPFYWGAGTVAREPRNSV
jgi:demethylmenaquinone methyltransferase/2-methoxy-6-polyprenyl-1,4-benzoquinol methylase